MKPRLFAILAACLFVLVGCATPPPAVQEPVDPSKPTSAESRKIIAEYLSTIPTAKKYNATIAAVYEPSKLADGRWSVPALIAESFNNGVAVNSTTGQYIFYIRDGHVVSATYKNLESAGKP